MHKYIYIINKNLYYIFLSGGIKTLDFNKPYNLYLIISTSFFQYNRRCFLDHTFISYHFQTLLILKNIIIFNNIAS